MSICIADAWLKIETNQEIEEERNREKVFNRGGFPALNGQSTKWSVWCAYIFQCSQKDYLFIMNRIVKNIGQLKQ